MCAVSETNNIQKKLLLEPDLKYKKAFEIAVAMETASNDAVESHSRHLPSAGVNKINTQHKTERQELQPSTTSSVPPVLFPMLWKSSC